jgi:hypothetical protein
MCATPVPHTLRSLRFPPYFPKRAETKAFWKAWDEAAATNAALGVGSKAAAKADSDASDATTGVKGPAAETEKEEEEGEEVSSKAADELAASLGGVKVAEEPAAAAAATPAAASS